MIKTIADWILYAEGVANVVVAILYALAHQPWKATYWAAAALVVYSVTRMTG